MTEQVPKNLIATQQEHLQKTFNVLRNRNMLYLMIDKISNVDGFENIKKILELAVNKLEATPPDVRGAVQDMNLVNLLMEEDRA